MSTSSTINDVAFWIIVGLLLATLLVILGLAFLYRHPLDGLTAYQRWRLGVGEARTRVTTQAHPLGQPVSLARGTEPTQQVVDEWSETEPQEVMAPLPVDPSNMPTFKNYVHSPGKDRRKCYCHQREIPDGPVLWWPMPKSPEVRLFCPEGVQSMEAAR